MMSAQFRFLLVLALANLSWGQSNGKLQIHFMDVGQGDGVVLITPGGRVALFDAGMDLQIENCEKPTSYVDQLGVTTIDAIFASHYHTDHIGCIPDVLKGRTVTNVYDRGKQYNTHAYQDYATAVTGKRQAPKIGDTFTLDTGANQVTIRIISTNGAGISTTNENDLSMAAIVSLGNFRAEIGGDLSGEQADGYEDIESAVVGTVGPLDVYKVHHHCSKYSTNATWLQATLPTIAIISTGIGNTYHHPAAECLERLHNVVKKAYWTESGNGGLPTGGMDIIAGNVIVQFAPGANEYTVAYGTKTDTYTTKLTGTNDPTPPPITPPGPSKFSWSKNSKIYHLSQCDWVKNINSENLQQGDTPPIGKTMHVNCPTAHN